MSSDVTAKGCIHSTATAIGYSSNMAVSICRLDWGKCGGVPLVGGPTRHEEEEEETGSKPREEHNVIILIEFAIALMAVLDQINKESFQRFRLRVGVNHRPVIAGVVGTQNPQYDIWSNRVNVASRMDSCGVIGRIQVSNDTAQMLMESGYELECRGLTYIKEKGNMTTYFVKTPYDNMG